MLRPGTQFRSPYCVQEAPRRSNCRLLLGGNLGTQRGDLARKDVKRCGIRRPCTKDATLAIFRGRSGRLRRWVWFWACPGHVPNSMLGVFKSGIFEWYADFTVLTPHIFARRPITDVW